MLFRNADTQGGLMTIQNYRYLRDHAYIEYPRQKIFRSSAAINQSDFRPTDEGAFDVR
jgi:hypothetical protein